MKIKQMYEISLMIFYSFFLLFLFFGGGGGDGGGGGAIDDYFAKFANFSLNAAVISNFYFLGVSELGTLCEVQIMDCLL